MRKRNRKGYRATALGHGIIPLFSVALSCMLLCGTAWAHKVTIFAWVEGDTVYTQSKFSGGKPAKNSTVVVYDDEGNQLLEGKTDDEGAFSFQVPKRTALTVALKASMGHLAEWTIPAEEVTGEPSDADKEAQRRPSGEVSTPSGISSTEGQRGGGRTVVAAGPGLSRQEIKELMDDVLDTKLAPIIRILADSVDRGPAMSDIVGGLGYIVGLMGVALYATNRRRSK